MRKPINTYPYARFLSVCNPHHLFLVFFLFLLRLTISNASDSPPPYTPTANTALDCGSSGNTTALDSRQWIGDFNSTFSLLKDENNSSLISKAIEKPLEVDPIPYYTARLSYSEFTYMFPVTAGQFFIRLYFYPASYRNFDRSKAFFSVKAGSHTLLSNFSAALTADSLNLEGFSREYCINVDDDQTLNITITPSPTPPDSYAFINGIEIVSMPLNLYFNHFIGDDQNTAMESEYRLNVGGSIVSPAGDTGMFRSWSDNDDAYLTDSKQNVLPVNTSIQINFSRIPAYTAPEVVYRTARTMRIDKNINKKYNLTWEFPVDSGFTYLVRLHFCEFQPEIHETGQKKFLIFIAEQIVEAAADVIAWSGGRGIPVYKDYSVSMRGNENENNTVNLSIALQANPADWKAMYSDVIMNGIEIFKLTILIPRGPQSPLGQNRRKSRLDPKASYKINGRAIIGIIVAFLVISGIVLGSCLCFLFSRRAARLERVKNSGNTKKASSTATTTKAHFSSLPSDLCRCFSLPEIETATNSFDDVLIIGVGGFGNVYKGHIDGGSTAVAIKRLNPGSQQGAHEFKTEIELLSQLCHRHLVSLIGYCNDEPEMILVYDYMARGTLRDHLYNSNNPPLSWNQRLRICIGAARGLQYLHRGAKHSIIHRDVKTTNILLDEKWVAKVSDFGLSVMGPTNISKTHISTVVKGSIGYLDPEYYRFQQLTEKSDVYSFGVVLCEALCSRPPVFLTMDEEHMSLALWARNCYLNGKLDEIVDPNLKDEITPECLEKFGEITMNCLLDDRIKRPSMNEVVWGLEFALQLQASKEEADDISLGGAHAEINSNEDEEEEEEEEGSFLDLPIDDSDYIHV